MSPLLLCPTEDCCVLGTGSGTEWTPEDFAPTVYSSNTLHTQIASTCWRSHESTSWKIHNTIYQSLQDSYTSYNETDSHCCVIQALRHPQVQFSVTMVTCTSPAFDAMLWILSLKRTESLPPCRYMRYNSQQNKHQLPLANFTCAALDHNRIGIRLDH